MNIDQDILDASPEKVLEKLLDLRNLLRKMEKEVNDEVCYLDLERLFEQLPEYEPKVRTLLPLEQHLKNCAEFHKCLKNTSYTSIDELYKSWDKVCPYKREDQS